MRPNSILVFVTSFWQVQACWYREWTWPCVFLSDLKVPSDLLLSCFSLPKTSIKGNGESIYKKQNFNLESKWSYILKLDRAPQNLVKQIFFINHRYQETRKKFKRTNHETYRRVYEKSENRQHLKTWYYRTSIEVEFWTAPAVSNNIAEVLPVR